VCEGLEHKDDSSSPCKYIQDVPADAAEHEWRHDAGTLTTCNVCTATCQHITDVPSSSWILSQAHAQLSMRCRRVPVEAMLIHPSLLVETLCHHSYPYNPRQQAASAAPPPDPPPRLSAEAAGPGWANHHVLPPPSRGTPDPLLFFEGREIV
jgi:hypothetical protein